MVSVPLGIGAFKRTFDGSPEIKLINRFVEKSITNQREHIALMARPGSALLTTAGSGPIRCLYSKIGLFNSDLFIVSGTQFFRYSASGALTQITGALANNGFTYATWMKGIGYEFLFLSDGSTLQYYSTHAVGTLTLTLNAVDGNITNQVIQIGGVYYTWGTNVEAGTPAGTVGSPYIALLGTASASTGETADNISLDNMVALINGSGIAGYNYSSQAIAASTLVTATNDATHIYLTAIADQFAGNGISTTVSSGSYLAWGATTTTGGGNQALQAVAMPNAGEVPKALAPVSSFVLVSVGGANKFYWIQPGATVIQALDFASKESNPDPIVDMTLVGDTVLISGQGSAENWYATGDPTGINPFAPVQGRVYRRGVLDGTPVVVKDSTILVGDDGVVYQIGYQYGSTAQWGVNPVSDHGIEERIRTQIRTLNGWPA